jgi:hypothetical protein
MRPRERRETSEQDLFRSRLDQIIDVKHALVKLARAIDWGFLEQTFGAVYTDKPGQPPLPTRLMAGLFDPQAHLRPFRRGSVRSLGGESVLLVLLWRGVFPTCLGLRDLNGDVPRALRRQPLKRKLLKRLQTPKGQPTKEMSSYSIVPQTS